MEKRKIETNGSCKSYFSLFRYADMCDWIMITVGAMCAILVGAAFPIGTMFLGDLTTQFVNYNRYAKCNFAYRTCYNLSLTFLNESSWNTTVIPELQSFESDVIKLVEILAFISFAQFFLAGIQIFAWTYQADRQIAKIKAAFFKAILRQDIAYHDVTSAGELSSRLVSDTLVVREGFGEKVAIWIQYTTRSISCLVVAFTFSWKVAFISLSVTPLLVIAHAFMYSVSSTYAKKEQAAYAKAGAIAEEAISAIRTVVAFGCQHREVERYSSHLNHVKSVEVRRGFMSGFGVGLMYLTAWGMVGLSFWYGAKLHLVGENTSGSVLVATGCVLFAASNFGKSSGLLDCILKARVAGSRIMEVIDRVPEIDVFSEKGKDPSGLNGEIAFKNVYFTYPSRPNVKVLKGVSLVVENGQRVALVGESGVGKSTIAQLIQRFFDCQSGSITVGGIEVESLHLRKYREMIGVVSQEPVLFATTIAENIRWGREGITDEEIIEAAKQANAYDFIMDFPKKFETFVGDCGETLSGGQKQRIAIARAIARNPKILLLDEATSALDTESESLVQAALDKACIGRTTVVIAHRLSTIRNADKIIAFQEGRVAEEGCHDDLLKNENGAYANLIKIQADDTHESCNRRRKMSERYSYARIEDFANLHAVIREESFGNNDTDDEEIKKLPSFSLVKTMGLNKADWMYIALGCIFATLAGLADPIAAILFSELFNIFNITDPNQLNLSSAYIGVGFLGLGLVAFISCSLESTLFAKSGVELTIRLRKKAFQSLLRQDISYFDDPKNSTEVLCTRLSTDALRVQGCTGVTMGTVIKNVAILGAALVIAFSSSWKLALVVIAFIPFMIVGMMIMVSFLTQRIKNERGGELSWEAIKHIRTIASLNAEMKMLHHYKNILKENNRTILSKAARMGLAFGFEQCVIFFAFAATFRLGMHLVLTGESNIVLIYRVITAVYFGAIAIGRNNSLAPDFAAAKLSARRLFALFDHVPVIDAYSEDGAHPDYCKGELSFRSVTFRYPSRPVVSVLRNFKFTVKPGQTLALIGQSGCGKSTSVQLMERFYDPSEGVVSLDGIDITKLNVRWLRQQIGLVSQEPVLFNQSIKENILFGDCTTKEGEVEIESAAKSANIHDFIAELPNGYSTNVGAGGNQLSGGQKQRVAIARALLRNPKILILDEATSALDTENEKMVQKALDQAREGRTCIMIAHRLSTVKSADYIAVIDKGMVIEFGTHNKLITQRGAYFNLVNSEACKNKELSAT